MSARNRKQLVEDKRKILNLSMTEAAKQIGIPTSSYVRWLKRPGEGIHESTAQKIDKWLEGTFPGQPLMSNNIESIVAADLRNLAAKLESPFYSFRDKAKLLHGFLSETTKEFAAVVRLLEKMEQ